MEKVFLTPITQRMWAATPLSMLHLYVQSISMLNSAVKAESTQFLPCLWGVIRCTKILSCEFYKKIVKSSNFTEEAYFAPVKSL